MMLDHLRAALAILARSVTSLIPVIKPMLGSSSRPGSSTGPLVMRRKTFQAVTGWRCSTLLLQRFCGANARFARGGVMSGGPCANWCRHPHTRKHHGCNYGNKSQWHLRSLLKLLDRPGNDFDAAQILALI